MQPSAREHLKFYRKIRRHLDSIETDADHHLNQNIRASCGDVPEDKLFGNVTKEEFQSILNVYDARQNNDETKDKPVSCGEVFGQSYEKLLFSKQGFHHSGSTAYLVENLGVKDASRSSFLGGLSTYSVSPDDKIDGLIKNQLRVGVKQTVREANELLDASSFDAAKDLLSKASKLIPNDADVIAAQGRHAALTLEWPSAIEFFKRSLSLGPSNKESIAAHLSDALYQHGYKLYSSNRLSEAVAVFEDSLEYNPNNSGSMLHRNLCNDRIRANTPRWVSNFSSMSTYR